MRDTCYLDNAKIIYQKGFKDKNMKTKRKFIFWTGRKKCDQMHEIHINVGLGRINIHSLAMA